MRKRGNRALILETARQQFNAGGTGPVSTNHIARAAEVSPGNLYYHFRNKQEIIRELYLCQVKDYGSLWSAVRPDRTVLLRIVDLLYDGFRITWKYRFLAREMVSLMQIDPWLAEEHRTVYQTRSALIPPMVEAARGQGMIDHPDDSQLVDDLNRLIWMVTYYWIPFFELEGTGQSEQRFAEGTRLCLRVIEPYLSPDTRAEVFAHLDMLAGSAKER